jgi:hypothetical protein
MRWQRSPLQSELAASITIINSAKTCRSYFLWLNMLFWELGLKRLVEALLCKWLGRHSVSSFLEQLETATEPSRIFDIFFIAASRHLMG